MQNGIENSIQDSEQWCINTSVCKCNNSVTFHSVLHVSSLSPHANTPSPVDGQWSAWTPWGRCSVSCGTGLQSRYRFCSNPQQSGSGLPCLGPHREDQVCIAAPCDRQFPLWHHQPLNLLAWCASLFVAVHFLCAHFDREKGSDCCFRAHFLTAWFQVMVVGVSGAAGQTVLSLAAAGFEPGGDSATAPFRRGRGATVRVWALRLPAVTRTTVLVRFQCGEWLCFGKAVTVRLVLWKWEMKKGDKVMYNIQTLWE